MSKDFIYTEEVTGEIVQIPVELLHHHHNNPRKDLGDLAELTDSIKAKGVLQNLTVVPFWFKTTGVGCDDPKQQAEMGYLVVIGNRRLEAAKAAGLETLPCIIANMTPAEQVQTMLLENMQRSDLTMYEQAQGFQMMLDFGDSIDTVSEKTGFSKSTIRRRLKMAELDGDTLKNVSGRQLSLMDFDRLAEIDDLGKRNEVLKEIGTANFENQLKRAIQEQKTKEAQARWRDAFEKIGAKEIDYKDTWSGEYAYVNPGYFDIFQDTSKLDEVVTDSVQYYFAFNYASVYLRTKKSETVEDDEARIERERKEAEMREQTKALEEAFKRAFDLRMEFIKGLSNSAAKKNFDMVMAFIVENQWTPDICIRFDYEIYAQIIGAEIEDESSMSYDLVKEVTEASIYKAALAFAYALCHDSPSATFKDWNNNYRENEILIRTYEFLLSLGYEMSDEEVKLMNGTSDLYSKPQSEEEEASDEEIIGDEEDIFNEDEANDEEIANTMKEMYGDGSEE